MALHKRYHPYWQSALQLHLTSLSLRTRRRSSRRGFLVESLQPPLNPLQLRFRFSEQSLHRLWIVTTRSWQWSI